MNIENHREYNLLMEQIGSGLTENYLGLNVSLTPDQKVAILL